VSDLFVALIHHPVVNRNAEIVTSAITSLDIHDIARASRTYDVRSVFIVHPIPEQRKFAASVIDHCASTSAAPTTRAVARRSSACKSSQNSTTQSLRRRESPAPAR
jgi:hypothetical protein